MVRVEVAVREEEVEEKGLVEKAEVTNQLLLENGSLGRCT